MLTETLNAEKIPGLGDPIHMLVHMCVVVVDSNFVCYQPSWFYFSILYTVCPSSGYIESSLNVLRLAAYFIMPVSLLLRINTDHEHTLQFASFLLI